MSSPIIFVGAFPFEIRGIKKRGRFRKAPGAEYYTGEIGGHPAVLAVSGIGGERAYSTASKLIAVFPDARAYISVGLSASLVPELHPGAVVAATEIVTISPNNSYPCDPGLIDALSATGCRTGTFIASHKTIITSSEKREIASANVGAIALDMESGGAARACAESGVPFISIRAISDSLDEDLPVDFDLFMRDGKIACTRLALHIARHPSLIPKLLRLGRNSRMACEKLGEAIKLL